MYVHTYVYIYLFIAYTGNLPGLGLGDQRLFPLRHPRQLLHRLRRPGRSPGRRGAPEQKSIAPADFRRPGGFLCFPLRSRR